MCAEDDAEPTLTVDLAKPLRGTRFLFGPLGSSEAARGEYARPTRVAVAINGDRDEHVLELTAEWPRKDVLELPRRSTIRSFRVRILARDAEGARRRATGFAEVELQDR